MTLRVTLLGTGPSQGVPSIGGADGRGQWGECDPAEPRNRRTRTSALIEAADGTRLMVDTGPDFRAQMLAAGIARFDALLITHAHADHVAGLDELRAINRAMDQVVTLFGSEATLVELKRRFGYAFLPRAGFFFRPAIEGKVVVPGQTLELGPMAVELIDLDHGVMPSIGLRIGTFAYTTDVIRIPPESLARLHGLDTWVISCMQPGLNPVHAGLDQVLEWWAMLKPRRTILTHLGDRMDHATITARLPKGVELGVDGQAIEIP
ncbi:MAG: fold metallo-hydrolase [Rubritepida sp.]|nr:fold metallo-hydrolase [Rubritepida sp.]